VLLEQKAVDTAASRSVGRGKEGLWQHKPLQRKSGQQSHLQPFHLI